MVYRSFFDGKFEISHINAPSEMISPDGMVPFSIRKQNSINHRFHNRTWHYTKRKVIANKHPVNVFHDGYSWMCGV